MFSFHVNLNLDILFEKLTAQIGVPLGLGKEFRFAGPRDLWVDIVKIQGLTSV